ncbi:MAG: ferrous iron transport protein B, partial [Clostridiales bacterium]|nr:ferrous iron transport protein B [Clostridiales bacterium]
AIKVFERDEKIVASLQLNDSEKNNIEHIIKYCEQFYDDTSESIIISQRYDYIEKAVASAVVKKSYSGMTFSDKIDKVVTNKFLALPIFACIMFVVYFLSISTIGGSATDFVNEKIFGENGIPKIIGDWLTRGNVSDWLSSLILDGIISGLGAVLGFLPQMCMLFLCLALLEDCGYMSRIAFILDRLFRRFGLSGKSFIPILVGTGCGVPGIMASRTIESQNDRRMTIITTTFIPCSAKLPIISLIAGSVFKNSAWVAPSAYFAGIAAIVLSGIALKKLKMFSGNPAPFIMELPAYHVPHAATVFKTVVDRASEFVKKAGTLILLSTVVIWFASSYSLTLRPAAAENSILGRLGGLIAGIFHPIGWGNWKTAVAALTGLTAKESVVSTLSILYGSPEAVSTAFSPFAGYSFLMFNLLCAPCFAAIGAIKSEMKSTKWTYFAIAYQTLLAYAVSLLIYQFGIFAYGGNFSGGTVAAVLVLLFIIFMLFKKPYKRSAS